MPRARDKRINALDDIITRNIKTRILNVKDTNAIAHEIFMAKTKNVLANTSDEFAPDAGDMSNGTYWVINPNTGAVRGYLTATPRTDYPGYYLAFFDTSGVLQVGVDADTGKLLAGAGGVILGSEGILVRSDGTPFLVFETADGATEIARVFHDGAGNLQFDIVDNTKSFTFNDGNVISGHGTGVDSAFVLHENFVPKAKVWWDASQKNLVITNLTTGAAFGDGSIILAINGSATDGWLLFDDTAGFSRFRFRNNGSFMLRELSAAPPDPDADFQTVYALDDGTLHHVQSDGTDEELTNSVKSVVAGTNVTVDNTDPANPIVSASGGGGGSPIHGKCYLSKSGSNLLLMPFDGNKIIINSAEETVPDAGVTLAPPAVASTTYYIYVYMNGATMTLEQSATAPTAQTGTGVQIKTGDATRTLVGMARTTAGNAWADSATQLFVLSYFNRKSRIGNNFFTTDRTTTSTTPAEINTEIRIEFLTWADEDVTSNINGISQNATIHGVAQTAIGYDGTAEDVLGEGQSYAAAANVAVAQSFAKILTVGYHYATVFGSTLNAAHVAKWKGSAAGAMARHVTLNLKIKG